MQIENVNNKYRTQFIARQREMFQRFLAAYGQAFTLATKPEQVNVLNDLAETFNHRQAFVTVRIDLDPMFAVNAAVPQMHQPFGFSPRPAMPIGHTVSYSTCTSLDDGHADTLVDPAVALMNEAMVPLNDAIESIHKFSAMLEATGE